MKNVISLFVININLKLYLQFDRALNRGAPVGTEVPAMCWQCLPITLPAVGKRKKVLADCWANPCHDEYIAGTSVPTGAAVKI